eukprot:4880444-Pleurochrysis_carterae.AAC.3
MTFVVNKWTSRAVLDLVMSMQQIGAWLALNTFRGLRFLSREKNCVASPSTSISRSRYLLHEPSPVLQLTGAATTVGRRMSVILCETEAC